MSHWEINTPLSVTNDSTSRYDKTEYQLPQLVKANDKQFRAEIKEAGSYFLLSETYLQVEFKVYKDANGTVLTESDGVSLDTPWSMFTDMKLKMNSKSMSAVNRPGTIAIMSQVPQASTDFQRSIQSSAHFYPLLALDCRGGGGADGTTNIAPVKLPSLIGNVDASNTSHPDYDFDTANIMWFPENDKRAKVQYEFTTAANSDVAIFTGKMRPNPLYDENFVRSVNTMTGGKTVSAMLPLREIFPMLAQAFSVVNRGANLELTWQVLSDNELRNAFFINGVDIPELTVAWQKVSLWTVRMTPSLATEAKLSNVFSNNGEITRVFEEPDVVVDENIPANITRRRIQVKSLASKPVRCIVGFRYSGNAASKLRHSHQFEPLNLSHLYMRVNGNEYPTDRYELNDHPTRVLGDLHKLALASDDYTDGSLVNFENWLSGPCRLYGIDLSQIADDVFKEKNVSDIEVHYSLSSAPVRAYDVVVLTVYERSLKIKLTGQEMVISL